MRCKSCKSKITDSYIIAVKHKFCSDVCHLRFWKDEMPNLGGSWITEDNLFELSYLSGEERELEYKRIINFISDNLDITKIMLQLRFGKESEFKSE